MQNVIAGDADDECDDDDLSRWPNAKTAELIEKFKAHPILYNNEHKLYYNKPKKELIIEKMADELNVTRE